MKTQEDFARIIKDIEFAPWEIHLGHDSSHFWLQIRAKDDINNVTGETNYSWHGRKWRLSSYATDTEVVKTALLAVKAAMDHEVLEKFKYKGVSIFDPHLSVDALLYARVNFMLDERK